MAFISHQWLGYSHPDPLAEQLTSLTTLLKRLLAAEVAVVDMDWQAQFILPREAASFKVTGAEWQASLPAMSLWLDYFGIPGITVREANDEVKKQDTLQALQAIAEQCNLQLVIPSFLGTEIDEIERNFESFYLVIFQRDAAA